MGYFKVVVCAINALLMENSVRMRAGSCPPYHHRANAYDV